jgi:hypothetical protein
MNMNVLIRHKLDISVTGFAFKGKDAIRQWMASMGDMEPPNPFMMIGAFVNFPGVAAQPLATICSPFGLVINHSFS